MNMLEKIQFQLKHLSESGCKVTEIILASPDNAIHSSIATLALEANVSEPTVNHFCCNMDTRGFPGFRLHLAQSLANGAPYVNRNANEDDNVESCTGKTFESAMVTLDRVHHSLDKSAISHAVSLLTQAEKIAFFGLGSSVAVVHDAMNKFFRFNVSVVYPDNTMLRRTSCMNCSDGDVVMLISHTGRTRNLIGLAQLIRENDAMVITLVSTGTPPTREAMLAITLDVSGDTDIHMPMVSRLAQLTVIDVLAARFTLWHGTRFRGSLRRVKEALKESRFDKQLLNLGDDCQKRLSLS